MSVVNPAQVYNYAKSLPRRAKTDRLDAQLLTQFAAERHPRPWTPPPAVYHELRQRLTTRDALIAMRTQARNHRHALVQWPVVVDAVKAQLDAVIADLGRRIDTLEAEIAEVLQNSAWTESARLLQTIKGGMLTAATLLVTTLNFRLCPPAEAAPAFTGLAPMTRESGSSVRGRPQVGHAGNARLRTALYMATLAASRQNPVIKPCYDRLWAAGKPKKVAMCAAARKLLHVAWEVGTKRQPFDPAYAQRGQPQRRAG